MFCYPFEMQAGTEAGSVMLFDVVDGVRFSKSFVKLEGWSIFVE